MVNDTQSGHSSGRRLDTGEGTPSSGLKRSTRDSSSRQVTSSPSSTRRSERLEKRAPSESPVAPRKSKRLGQQSTPSPLRRSDRDRTPGSSTPIGSKSSEKVSSSVDRQKKKEKKEKSVDQLTMEAVEVVLGENHDHEAIGLKGKKMTARSYKALFTKQRRLYSTPDSDDKLEGPDTLPQIDSVDSRASSSQLLEHQENGSLGCGRRVIADLRSESLEGAPQGSASSLKDSDAKISGNDVEPEFAYSSQSLPDKSSCPSNGTDLGVSLIACTRRDSMDDVNKGPKDQPSSGKFQIPDLVGSTSVERGDVESGDQCMQSERESCALRTELDVKKIVVNEDASARVVEAAPLASTEHENHNVVGNGTVCSNHNLVKLKESLSQIKPASTKFVEYWVPVPVSNLQLEQYCATLLTNAITLTSSSKKDDVGALQDILTTVRKCCNHPYIVDPSLQTSLMKGLPPLDILNVGIKASGKLELLDMILSKIRRRKLRVLILFQTVAGSSKISIGNILEDFLRERFGTNSYERIDACLSATKRKDAINKFNSKEVEQFVLLSDHRACSSRIKLSLDIIIIFDTQFNPANDINDLQKRLSTESQSEQIKVFRLYSCYTLEEKVLILAKHQKNVHNNLQNQNRAPSDGLLMWGAADLFNRLDEYHAEKSTVPSADISSGQQLLDDIVKNFMAKIFNNSNCEQDSIISKAFISEGVYHTDCLLLGEKEVQLKDGEERQIFWKKLLDGRNPQWKYFNGATPRSRKRVQYDETDEAVTKVQKVVDTRDTAPTFQPELEGRGQAAVSKAAINQSVSSSGSDASILDKANREPNLLSQENSFSQESDMAHPKPVTPLDEQRSLHSFLRVEMAKLCVFLKLSKDVEQMVGRFLEYVMENHHVNKEPASILQAFQMSLCWIAASILKERIDRRDSLMLAKRVLNFQCTEEEAYSVYGKLRLLKRTFLQLLGNISVPSPSQNVVSASEDIREQPPYAGNSLSASFDLQNVKVEVEERSSSLEPSEEQTIEMVDGNHVDRKIKKVQKKCEKHMLQLRQKHEKEILEFHKMEKQKRSQLEGEHQLELAFIRTTYHQSAMRMDKLKILDCEFKKKIQEHKNLMEMHLKDLEARHSAEIEEERKKVDGWMAKMMSYVSQYRGINELHINGSGHEMQSPEGSGHTTSVSPENVVPSAQPDVGELSPDRIMHDYGARNVTLSGISVTVPDGAVGSIVPSETLTTPVNPVRHEVFEIEPADVESVPGIKQPKEASQSSHQIQEINAQEAVGCCLHTETSSFLLNSTSGKELNIAVETSGVAGAEQLKEVNCLSHTAQNITLNESFHCMDETASVDLATSKEQNACEISSSGQNNEIPSGVPGTVGSQSGNACTSHMDTFLEPETRDGGNSAGSDATENQKDYTHGSISEIVPSPQLPSEDLVSVPSGQNNEIPLGAPGTVGSESGNACTLQMDTFLEPETQDGGGKSAGSDAMENQKDNTHGSISEIVPSPQLPSENLVSVPTTPFSELPQEHVPRDEDLSYRESLDMQDAVALVTGNLNTEVEFASSIPLDSGCTVQSNSEAQVREITEQLLAESVDMPDKIATDTGTLTTKVGFASSTLVDTGCTALSNCEAQVNKSTGQSQLTAEAVIQGHTEQTNSLQTFEASSQMFEGSVELLHQTVSKNGETIILSTSTEGIDSGHSCNSHVEGSNSLQTSVASPQMIEGSVELPHQSVSLNGETVLLPPSTEGISSGHCDNHCDLQIVNGNDRESNNEVSAISQNTVAPTPEAENLTRLPNEAPMLNPVILEEPIYLSVHQSHRTGYRNPTLPLHAEPLQNELESIRKDLEQTVKFYDSTKLRIKSECEKEIEETIMQIRSKYEAKLNEAESAFLLKKTELDSNHKKVFMNKILAEAFRSKCLDLRTSGNSSIKQAAPTSLSQHMLNLQPRQRHLSAATLSPSGQPATSQQTAIPPVQSLHRSSGLFPSVPARPPQISAITPSIGVLRVGGEIRAPAPHLQPFRPPACTSAASTSSLPGNTPGQQLPANIPATSLSLPSIPAQQPLPSIPSQFLLRQNSPPQPPAIPPHNRINQDASSNRPSETQNGVQPGRRNPTLSAVELLMDVDDQAGGHLPNILQHLAGSGLNTNALDPSVTRASYNVIDGLKSLAIASDVVCLSDDDG